MKEVCHKQLDNPDFPVLEMHTVFNMLTRTTVDTPDFHFIYSEPQVMQPVL
jgi:hypothetical protein